MTGRTRIIKTAILSGLLSFALAAAAGSPAQNAPIQKKEIPVLAEVYNVRSYAHPNYTRIVLDIGVLREYVWNETRVAGRNHDRRPNARLNAIVPETVSPGGSGYIRVSADLPEKRRRPCGLAIERRPGQDQPLPGLQSLRSVPDRHRHLPQGRPARAVADHPAAREKRPNPPSRPAAVIAWPGSSAWGYGRSSSIPATAAPIPAASIADGPGKRT